MRGILLVGQKVKCSVMNGTAFKQACRDSDRMTGTFRKTRAMDTNTRQVANKVVGFVLLTLAEKATKRVNNLEHCIYFKKQNTLLAEMMQHAAPSIATGKKM